MIRVKRGVKANLPTLWPGEPGMCLDDGDFYVGGNNGNVRISGPWVTPEAYGAKGDGVTDDTVAIQAAVNTKRPVCLSGQYIISDTITLPEGTHIFGTSPMVDPRVTARITEISSITINVNNKDIFDLDQTDVYWGYVWAVKIANVRLNGTGAGTSGAALNMTNSANIDVKNVSIRGTYNGIYVDFGMTNSFSDMNIQSCLNSCIYIDDTGTTTTQAFNNVTMRESPYGVIIRSDLPYGNGAIVFNDCLIESTTAGGVIIEAGSSVTFNNLYTENVPADSSIADGCIFECGLTGTGPISGSVLNVNGGYIGGGNGYTWTGSAIFRTKDWLIININGGKYLAATYFHEQVAGGGYLCAVNLSGVSCVGTDLYLVFDTSTQLHGTFLDGSLQPGQWFRNKIRTYPTLTANSLTAATASSLLVNITNLSAAITNGTFDSDASGWTATRGTLASVAGGESGNCLEITGDTSPNAAADQTVSGLVPSVTYTISGYAKAGTSGEGIGAYIVAYDTSWNALKTITWSLTSGWVSKTGDFVNPAGNTSVMIYLVKNSATAGTMFFDTVVLTANAPTAPADGFVEYSSDIVAGNAAPHFRTENGTVIRLGNGKTGNITIDGVTLSFENGILVGWPSGGTGTISAVSTLTGTGTKI